MAELKKARTEAKIMFTRTANALKDILRQYNVAKPLARRVEDLKRRWNVVQEKHEAYVTSLGENADTDEEDKWIDDIDFRYYELESAVDKMIEERNEEKEDGGREAMKKQNSPKKGQVGKSTEISALGVPKNNFSGLIGAR